MRIKLGTLKKIIREEFSRIAEEATSDVTSTIGAWIDDNKPTTPQGTRKTAGELAKTLAGAGHSRQDIDNSLKGFRSQKFTDRTKGEKLRALEDALNDPETLAGHATSTAGSRLPPMV